MDDGVSLNSMSHPQPPWWQRPYWWLRSLHVSEDGFVDVEVDARNDGWHAGVGWTPADGVARYIAQCFGYAWDHMRETRPDGAPWGFGQAVQAGLLCKNDFRNIARGALHIGAPKPAEAPPAEDLISPWHPMTDATAVKVLGKLNEECNELGAATARCIIQGVDEVQPVTRKPNRQWLTEELADVQAGINLCIEYFELDPATIDARVERKTAGLRKWHAGA